MKVYCRDAFLVIIRVKARNPENDQVAVHLFDDIDAADAFAAGVTLIDEDAVVDPSSDQDVLVDHRRGTGDRPQGEPCESTESN